MFCKQCGNQMDDFAPSCPACGTANASQTPPPPPPPQQTYQQPTYQQPTYQQPPAYQQPVYQQPYQAPVQDVASGGMKFLSFCIPLVGIILYFSWKDQKPLSAKAVLKMALIGVGVSVVLSIIYVIIMVVVMGAAESSYYYYQIASLLSSLG